MPSLNQMMLQVRVRSKRLYRQATWHLRSLPNFIVIGANKSGTTSLYFYLSQHPQLLPSSTKEVHFFDGGGTKSNINTFPKGPSWYRSHFPLKKDMLPHQKTFEASPSYICHPLVPRRIFELLPDVKIIALLRNPTERAIAHFFWKKKVRRVGIAHQVFPPQRKYEFYQFQLIEDKRYQRKWIIYR